MKTPSVDADKKAGKPEPKHSGDCRKQGKESKGASRSNTTGAEQSQPKGQEATIEAIVADENMREALKAVKRNGGTAGVDGKTIEATCKHLKEHWEEIRAQLMAGEYQPAAVRRVDIPKAGGGTRMLGIPTVTDRLIQQAIHQILSPIWEPHFSENSYGFRPRRGAHQAVQAAREYVADGYGWVVDMDLEKFFDRVNHDVLMARVTRRVKDKKILKLIRRYLQSGIMAGGILEQRVEGTPQGGPISPLLSNILLDDLDKELEKRGHKFCRYADDCNIYVRSKAAGERVLDSVRRFLEGKLRLKVNAAKSCVDQPHNRKFLGYSITRGAPRLKPAKASVEKFKEKVREKFRIGRGQKVERFIVKELNPLLRGWANYFNRSQTKTLFQDLDKWIRRKLRCLIWRQGKCPKTRARNLVKQGLVREEARQGSSNGSGPWRSSRCKPCQKAYPNSFFSNLKLVSVWGCVVAYQS